MAWLEITRQRQSAIFFIFLYEGKTQSRVRARRAALLITRDRPEIHQPSASFENRGCPLRSALEVLHGETTKLLLDLSKVAKKQMRAAPGAL